MSEQKRIKLTPDQYKALKDAKRKLLTMEKTLMKLFEEVSGRLADEDAEMWRQVYQIAGVAEYDANILIEWITGELVVNPIKHGESSDGG